MLGKPSRHYALPSTLFAAAVAAGVLGGPAAASAGAANPSIQITSPGAVGHYHRTANRQPVFDVEVNGVDESNGATLQCAVDSVFKSGPCGPPAPGCTAEICATYQPPKPLSIGGFSKGRHA